ncbi:response regulator transcription factor [Brumimicrobium oceani]|uniref:DNA-binding response regulator n=1 Tax=Brumimicrobium oceani TaxID=2100725 RepID=A0A2U2XED6_9FLAO|nr:response regulator transcription factor [Brumimicrobium oceani]PWH86133.1 DNA-binding response regulator [Brumimicrobium oceani]
MPKILIADDHPILLEGLYVQLKNLGYTNLLKANDGKAAWDLLIVHKPLIAILDIEMPFVDGLTIAKKCEANPDCFTKFIILSYHQEAAFLLKAKKLNIAGYVLKEDAVSEIENCLKAILEGKEYYSKVFSSRTLIDAEKKMNKLEYLTPSERKILKLIAQNLSTKEIGEQLFISIRTVEKHRSNIISKLGLKEKSISLLAWVNENKTWI